MLVKHQNRNKIKVDGFTIRMNYLLVDIRGYRWKLKTYLLTYHFNNVKSKKLAILAEKVGKGKWGNIVSAKLFSRLIVKE